MSQNPTKEMLELLAKHGDKPYPGEAITLLEHSIRTAWLAEQEKVPSTKIVAALLHNLEQILYNPGQNAAPTGKDNAPEEITHHHYIRRWFGEPVFEPIRMQPEATRYLQAKEPEYASQISETSAKELQKGKGPMTEAEADAFLKLPYAEAAIRLRHWHDMAMVQNLSAPPLDHFLPHLDAASTVTDHIRAAEDL